MTRRDREDQETLSREGPEVDELGKMGPCRHCRLASMREGSGKGQRWGQSGGSGTQEPGSSKLPSAARSVYFVRVTDRGLFSAPEIVTDPSSGCCQDSMHSAIRMEPGIVGRAHKWWALLF